MFQHYVTADRVAQYQQQCLHEATIERGLTGGRTAQLAIFQIAMAAVARSFAAAWRQLHTPRLADLK
jgi:hypothetical protein